MPITRLTALLAALPVIAACAYSGEPAAPARGTALPPPPPVATAGAAARGEVPSALLAACRAEAERATVFQNRGEMMRLDEAENRGAESLMQNQQERGLLVVRRDRLFRECLERNRAQAAPGQPVPQVATPR